MKTLVTGGAGFVGGAVVRQLLERGDDVVVLDCLRTTTKEDVPDGARLVVGQAGDRTLLDTVLGEGGFDACLHFAGRIEAGASMRVPETFFSINVAESLVLFEALVAHEVDRVVFSSSAAVYGDPDYTPIDEDHPLRPVSAYGASKLLVEQALGWLARLGRLRYAALRYFNAAGAVAGRPEQHDPETHLIPLAIDAALGRRPPLVVFGDDYATPDGTCVRDYVHVDDLATAHLLALDALDGRDEVVCNLGSGTGSTNAEVVATVRSVTGRDVPVRVAPRRPGDAGVLVASSTRAQEELGWSAVRSELASIVEDAWSATVDGTGPR